MIYKAKFVSDEIISKLPNWLIHFLWFLLEENVQADPSFNGCFSLQRASEGQCISCQVNGNPREIIMPCPYAVDCKVEIIEQDDRLMMRLKNECCYGAADENGSLYPYA